MGYEEQKGMIKTYPLHWPTGWARTKNQRKARYGDRSLAAAREAVQEEVRKLGGSKLIISSNLELRQDGLPRSNQRQPFDRGMAIYFNYKGKPVSFACDKWTTVEDNLWAINLTISAIRQIDRSGASEMLDRAFRGFDALPAPAGGSWWEVLGVLPTSSIDEIKLAFRYLAKLHHPDLGGDAQKFNMIQAAYEAAQAERGGNNAG